MQMIELAVAYRYRNRGVSGWPDSWGISTLEIPADMEATTYRGLVFFFLEQEEGIYAHEHDMQIRMKIV